MEVGGKAVLPSVQSGHSEQLYPFFFFLMWWKVNFTQIFDSPFWGTCWQWLDKNHGPLAKETHMETTHHFWNIARLGKSFSNFWPGPSKLGWCHVCSVMCDTESTCEMTQALWSLMCKNVLCGLSHKETTIKFPHMQPTHTNLKPGTKM